MRSLIGFTFFLLFSCSVFSETLINIYYVEKIAGEFVVKMDKGHNQPRDVLKFIKKLKVIKKYNVSTFIETLKYVNYSKFDKKKCLQYKKILIARASSPAVELNDDNIDIDLYYSLKILAKVCQN